MVNVIIYSMDEIDFCKLKNFKYHNFTLTAYGKLDNTWWCVYGNYDFEIAFISKDIDDLDEVLTKIVTDCSGSLQDYELLTISKSFIAKTLPINFLKCEFDKSNKKE